MPNSYFQFKQFTVHQDRCAMKVTTDACLFGAWVAAQEKNITRYNVLDAGAGTGLLGLMLAQAWPESTITGVELDEAAAEQAAANAADSPWAERLDIQQADLRDFRPVNRYDIIISNPPFYEQDLRSPDPSRNRAHHDSSLTLADLLNKVPEWLQPGGRCYLLMPFRRKEETEAAVTLAGGYLTRVTLVRPAPHLDYFRLMLAVSFGQNTEEITERDEILIRDATGNYTPAFTGLLRPFYLYL